MINKSLELDNKEVKRAIKHWINNEIEGVGGKAKLEDIKLKATESSSGGKNSLGRYPKPNGARVKIKNDKSDG